MVIVVILGTRLGSEPHPPESYVHQPSGLPPFVCAIQGTIPTRLGSSHMEVSEPSYPILESIRDHLPSEDKMTFSISKLVNRKDAEAV